jgi:hypothetical protein
MTDNVVFFDRSKNLSLADRLRIIYCSKDNLAPCGVCLTCQAADEIERLCKELKVCQAERDHHDKWSKNYEQEIYKLRDQIKNCKQISSALYQDLIENSDFNFESSRIYEQSLKNSN